MRSVTDTRRRAEAELAALWAAYKDGGGPDARNALVVHYAPLVKYVAARVGVGLPQSVEQADLVSYGMFGLIDAIDRFDPRRGFRFETYAISRIRGAIVDELRAVDWVPRSVRAKLRELEVAMRKLEAAEHRAPSDSELAAELGWTEGQLRRALTQIANVGLVALDELLPVSVDLDDVITLGDTIADRRAHGPMGAFEAAETRQVLAAAVDALPEQERAVLILYYFEHLTLAEVGRALGVSESRACQVHTKALLHLRSRLGPAEHHSHA